MLQIVLLLEMDGPGECRYAVGSTQSLVLAVIPPVSTPLYSWQSFAKKPQISTQFHLSN